MVSKFYEKLLAVSERKTYEIPELIKRPSKICSTRYTLNMMKGLELDCEVLLAGLLLAKAAVDSNLRISKKFLNRFDCC